MAVSNQQSRDAALLRATTELFALGSRHDPDEIRRFEELATHFLGKVSAADRGFVAERLARAKDAPSSVLRILGKDLVEIASPVLRKSEALTEIDLLSIISSTGPAHHRQIAQRPDLPRPVVAALRIAGDPETRRLLVGYPDSEETRAEPIQASVPMQASAPARTSMPALASADPSATSSAPKRASVASPAAKAAELPSNRPRTSTLARDPGAREVFATARAMTAALSLEMESFSFLPSTRAEKPKTEDAPIVSTDRPAVEMTPAHAEPSAPAPGTEHMAQDDRTTGLDASKHREIPSPAAPATTEPSEESHHPTSAHALSDFLSMDARGRQEALARLCGRVGPADPGMTVLDADSAFRVALGGARASQSVRRRQRESLIRALAEGLRLEVETVTMIVDDPSGEALVVLLRAIGLSESETHQVLLFANPVMAGAVDAFFRLARLGAEMSRDAAGRIIAEWRPSDRPARTGHQPILADAELRRSIAGDDRQRGTSQEAKELRSAG